MPLPPDKMIRAEARLLVIEHFLVKLYAASLSQAADPGAAIDAMETNWLARIDAEGFGDDPAVSDLLSAVVAEEAQRLVTMIREMLAPPRG